MARYKILGLIVIATLFLTALVVAILLKDKKEVIDYSVKKLRFVFEVTNKSDNYLQEANFTFALPMNINNRQELLKVDSTQKYSIINKGSGRQYAEFAIEGLPPSGKKIVKVDVQVRIAEQAIKGGFEEYHLSPEKHIEYKDPLIQSVVKRFKEGEQYPFSIFEWANNNIESSEYRVNSKGAVHALKQRSGDCTEHMYVYMALARAGGSPARGVSGFVVTDDVMVLSASQYHNWAEFHDSQYWRLVDTQNAIFDDQYEEYVVFDFLSGDGRDDMLSGFVTTDSEISIRL